MVFLELSLNSLQQMFHLIVSVQLVVVQIHLDSYQLMLQLLEDRDLQREE